MKHLPPVALSIRQPWAWAIARGHKDVENRSTFAVSKGTMDPRPIAIHAAQGMTREEYEDAADFMRGLGVECPRPDQLVRGAIIGAVTVTAVVSRHPSPWFFGPRGLLLRDPIEVQPIPARGALGYFAWSPGGAVLEPLPWMTAWPADHRPRRVAPPQQDQPPAALPLFD